MRVRSALIVSACFLTPTAYLAASAAGARPAAPKAGPVVRAEQARFDRHILPLMTRYCVGCHSGAKPAAELDIRSAKTEADVLKNRPHWERIANAVRGHHMPPPGAATLAQRDRDLISGWIHTTFSRQDCDLRDPGRVTLRRLNRNEYNNTVRDLLGVEIRPADEFPSDDVGYGFDNIGDVLSISPLLMEKYLSAAEKVAARAVWTPDGASVRYSAGDNKQTSGQGTYLPNGRGLYGNGDVTAQHTFTAAGTYAIRALAYGQQAGSEPVKMAFKLGASILKTVEVAADETSPKVYEVTALVEPGKQPVSVSFTNDFYDPNNPDRRRRDRNLVVGWIEVAGPMDAKPSDLPATHRKLFGVTPLPTDKRAAARQILGPFLRRAYRRPVAPAEVESLLRYVDLAQKEGDSFERGIQLAVEATLISPSFLFRVEMDGKPLAPKQSRPLNDHELASRLSYFIWSSMPDDRLFQLADKGQLKSPVVLEAEVQRMLKDPKARGLVENFAGQWLNLRLLQNVNPDPKQFPSWDESLRAGMREETERFIEAIIREDRSIVELIDARYTFLNERLARHYGIDGVTGSEFRRVTLPDKRRGGVLTQASVLTLTSNPTRTSPVKRGKWVMEQILGTPPPEPPPNVPPLEVDANAPVTGTLRQKMVQHRVNPLCASCHERMDTIGFGLENFDAIGRWRDSEDAAGKFKIDASGKLPGIGEFAGPSELRTLLTNEKDQFVRNFVGQLMTFGLGRGMEYYDRCAINRIADTVAKKQYRFSTIVIEIVKSDPFRMRRGDAS